MITGSFKLLETESKWLAANKSGLASGYVGLWFMGGVCYKEPPCQASTETVVKPFEDDSKVKDSRAEHSHSKLFSLVDKNSLTVVNLSADVEPMAVLNDTSKTSTNTCTVLGVQPGSL